MTGKAKPTPVEAFELNIADAQWLLDTARSLTNQRSRRMRTEMREKVGEALGIAQRDRRTLDCIESSEVFVVIKPGGSVRRDHVKDLSALYRQAVEAPRSRSSKSSQSGEIESPTKGTAEGMAGHVSAKTRLSGM